MADAGHTHRVEQIQAELREIASVVAQHRQDLIDNGMPEAEAFALAQAVEERWAGTIFARYEGRHERRAWETVLEEVRRAIHG